tara:strand:- start:165 stop:539 length:375 start_codon:yes stop_codon:yes gene_type:complete
MKSDIFLLEANLLLEVIVNFLEKNKAQNVVSISLEGKSEEADYMVIASGNSNRQVIALSSKLIQEVKKLKAKSIRIEGMDQSEWVLIDFGDIIVHLFLEEVRNFYKLEKLWQSDSSNNKVSDHP